MLAMIVEVKQGKLEGIQKKSDVTGQEYVCFHGIPYAKPPIGDLRFRVSQNFHFSQFKRE